ncbi:MAG TPA: peroxiredoxin [Caulobacteraceae bacterium]
MAEGPKVGDAAPDFDLETDQGRLRRSDLGGKIVVLYFYPKDDTPGCTNEAIGFSQAQAEFEKAGAVVIGVSKDSVKRHANFRAKHGLTVGLGSDPEGEMIQRYGVWVEKTLYGRQYMGIERATFLIGRDGLIHRVWRKVKVPGHVAEVLAAVKGLG